LPNLGENQGIVEAVGASAISFGRMQLLANSLIDQELGNAGSLGKLSLHSLRYPVEDARNRHKYGRARKHAVVLELESVSARNAKSGVMYYRLRPS
jgi:hypothetical protein